MISLLQLRPSRTAGIQRVIILLGSDFNAKVWKSLNNDSNQDPCLERHSKGGTNEIGQSLVDWCNIHNWFVCNTAFQYPSRHMETTQNQ